MHNPKIPFFVSSFTPLLLCGLLAVSQGFASPIEALKAGNKALESGRVEEAKTSYLKGFVHAPDSPELHYSMGLAHLREKKLKEAATFFEKAAVTAEASGNRSLAAQARYNLGLSLASTGTQAPQAPQPSSAPVLGSPSSPVPPHAGAPADLKGAVDAFKKAIELDPSDMDAKYNFVKLKRALQKQQKQQQQSSEGDSEEKSEDKDQKKDQNNEQDKKNEQSKNSKENKQEPNKDSDPSKDPSKQDPSDSKNSQEKDPAKPPPEEPSDSDKPSEAPPKTQEGEGQEEKDRPPMDPRAMERFLDALESESKEQLKKFLRSRRAQPREVTHDW